MTLAPGRFDYAPINDRPIIKWPENARVAFWVAPNMEFFEYLPQNRPTQPDIPLYSRMDYGNRVGVIDPRFALEKLSPIREPPTDKAADDPLPCRSHRIGKAHDKSVPVRHAHLG